MKTKYSLGTIELDTEVYVSDPCYNTTTWCQALIEGLKPGKYHGFMNKQKYKDWGIRVTDLWIVHEDNINAYPETLVKDVTIGVDSGAAGIYDKDYYEKYHDFEEGEYIDDNSESSKWYDKQFNLRYDYDMNGHKIMSETDTRERRDAIALDNKCVISFSGFGDGSYNLYVAKNKQKEIVGLRIRFI